MSKKRKILFGSAALVVFVTASITISIMKRPYSPGDQVDVTVQFAGIKPVMGASSDWSGVRGTATFMRSVARGVDSLLVSLNSSGILNSLSGTVGPFTSGSYRFQISAAASPTYAIPVAGAVSTNEITGTSTYKKKFQLCVGSSQALELYFDSASDPGGSNGAVVIWSPKLFDTSLTGNASIIKCQFGIASGKKQMLCAWAGGPIDAAGNGVSTARLKAYDDTTNNQIDFLGVAGLNFSVPSNVCGAGNSFYSLAYIASKTSPYNTVAGFGCNNAAPNTTSFVQINGATNNFNYGFFNASASGYYVTSSTSDQAGYPTIASLGANVITAGEVTAVGTTNWGQAYALTGAGCQF